MTLKAKLSPEDLAMLWQANADGSLGARDALAEHYESFARYLAKRAKAKAPAHQDLDDLISYAHHALLDALSKYRPDMGFKFETYATRRIAGGIADELRRQDPLTRNARQRVKQLSVVQEHFWETRGRSATLAELADELGCTIEQVDGLQVQQQTMTADISEYDDIADRVDEVSDLEGLEADLRRLLATTIARLPELERSFIALHYGERLSLAELGRRASVTDVRCGQIRKRAILAIAS